MTATVADQLAFDALPVEVQALARRVFEPLLVEAFDEGFFECNKRTGHSVPPIPTAIALENARLLAQGVGG